MVAHIYVWIRGCFAAFGGFMFGYDLGAINGVKDMQGFRETFDIPYVSSNSSSTECSDDVEASTILGLIVSVSSLGALVGALFAGTLADIVGRKLAITSGAATFAFGGAIQAGAVLIWMIYVGRVVSGIGIGVLFVVVPIYIAELAPKRQRGRMVNLITVWLAGGILAGLIVNLVTKNFDFGWRVSLGLQCVWGSVLATGMMLLPETPRWLVKKGKTNKATKILMRVYQNDESKVMEVLRDVQAAEKGGRFREMVKALFHWKVIERVFLGTLLQFMSRLVGISVILYYSVSIFCKIGAPPYITSTVVGFLGLLTTAGLFLVDKFGRKSLLLLGGLAMMLIMTVAGTLTLVFRVEEGENKAVGYIVVVLISLFVLVFNCTWPVTWVVSSEIYPMKVKGVSVSLTTTVFWIGNLLMAQITPIMLASPLRTHGTFYFLAGTNLLASAYVLLTLPETKGMSLESIDVLFSKPWLERTQVLYYLRCSCLGCRGQGRRQPEGITSHELGLKSGGEENYLHVKNPLFEDGSTAKESS